MVAVAGVVVAAGIGVVIAVSRAPEPPPDQVVAGFGQAYTAFDRHPNAATLAALEAYLCPRDVQREHPIYGVMATTPGSDRPTATELTSNTRITGDTGTFTLTYQDQYGSNSLPGHLIQNNGTWQICNTM